MAAVSTFRAAVVPTARAMDRLSPAAGAALAVGLAGWAVLGHRSQPEATHLPALRLAMLTLAAGAAFALDDPAEATVAASPVTLARRRVIRLAVIVSGWALAWAAVTALVGLAPGSIPLLPVTVEAAGWMALSLAVAVTCGGTASPPALVVSFILAVQLPERYWLLTGPAGWSGVQARWAALLLAAGSIVAWWSRDPARPGVTWGRRPTR
jgi:hypothetical protein